MACNLCLPKCIPTFERSKGQEIASSVQRIGTRIGNAFRLSRVAGALFGELEIRHGRLDSFPASAMGCFCVGTGVAPAVVTAREGGWNAPKKQRTKAATSNRSDCIAAGRETAEPCAEWWLA